MMDLNHLAQKVGTMLKSRHLILATAESCTGGGLSYFVTSVPGSSHWFDRGFVTYTDQAKIDLLNVKPTTLATFGAVSEAVAKEMAIGALNRSQATVSIAITGIAGPDGGTKEKPVGLVWIAWCYATGELIAEGCRFSGDRAAIREQAIELSLSMLLNNL